ncbi:MAG: ISNCY family transposase [Nanoarchaeota archaeon]|nr:ISNCY family transposase [Nanoarchaeota archaeon]
MLKTKDIREKVKDIEDFLLDQYKATHPEKERSWRTYEEQLNFRIKYAMRSLEPLVDEAVGAITTVRTTGRLPQLTIKQKVMMLLTKSLVDKSNRNMAGMLMMFSLLSEIDVSYKSIERLYSDPEVEMAIHNLHILILKKKGVEVANACGDGTGYSLTVKTNYASETQKRKDKAKENAPQQKKAFAFSFRMMDLDSQLYIGWGMSMHSEKEAFDRAMQMIFGIGIEFDSVRLDRYYSAPVYVDRFERGTKVYIFPKKNATVKGSWAWKERMGEFVDYTIPYLENYYKRNLSEAGFSSDKRNFGWEVRQKREERIDMALNCTGAWHNLFNLGRP